MSETSISPDLLAAYRGTQYRVFAATHPFTLLVGQRSAELADLYERYSVSCAVFITADNPFSRATSDRDNADARARLRAELERLSTALFDGEGQGADNDWPAEQSFLALGVDKDAASRLGRMFGQNAVVWVGPDVVPELVLLR